MTSAFHFNHLIARIAYLVLFTVFIVSAYILYNAILLPDRLSADIDDTHSDQFTKSSADELSKISSKFNWSVFQTKRTSPMGSISTGISKNYRLAGTFFQYNANGASNKRRAILDNLNTKIQEIVSEGSMLEDFRVVSVFRDRVVFRSNTTEEELRLSFMQGSENSTNQVSASSMSTNALPFEGRRVGAKSWVFSRQSILNYYAELANQPQRLLNIFDSLKPVYNDQNDITGYYVGIEGEKPFFDAIGFKEGDIVRRVNSMKMDNRLKAEYFIKEFVKNRVNVFDLEIERNNSKEKLMYQLR